MYNGYESHVDVYFDLVYFTLGHLRRPGQVQVPKGSGDTRWVQRRMAWSLVVCR
jgi:hypothetical protein